MNEMEKRVHTLDLQVTELQKNIHELQTMVTETQEENLDLASMEKYARNKKFVDHILKDLGQEEGYHYCCILASAIPLTNDVTKKSKQYFFLFRLYHTCYEQEIGESLLRDSQMISMKDWEVVAGSYDADMIDCLLEDMLLMISLDGKIDEKQLDYFLETAAYFLEDINRVKHYFGVVKAILSVDEEAFMNMAKVININSTYPYLGKKTDYYITSKIDHLNELTAQKVMIYGAEVANLNEVLELDQYKEKTLLFSHCTFTEIMGIKAHEVKLRFDHCTFERCGISRRMPKGSTGTSADFCYAESKQNYHFLDLHSVELIDCLFERCVVEGGGRLSSLILLKDAKLQGCSFKNCNVGTHDAGPYATVIMAMNSNIMQCKLEGCTVHGENSSYDGSYWLEIIRAYGGKVQKNIFEKCECRTTGVEGRLTSFYNYILDCDKTCFAEKNLYSDCIAKNYNNSIEELSNCLLNDFFVDEYGCYEHEKERLGWS